MARRLGIEFLDVAEAAVSVVRAGEPLTVAAVAERLGCAPPSIYHHVPNGLRGLHAIVRETTSQIVTRKVATHPDPLWGAHLWAKEDPALYEYFKDDLANVPELARQVEPPFRPLLSVVGDELFPEFYRWRVAIEGDELPSEQVVDKELLRCALDLFMASDPSPLPAEDDAHMASVLNERARRLGYETWVDAYHLISKGKEQTNDA